MEEIEIEDSDQQITDQNISNPGEMKKKKIMVKKNK
jgi:hypothetical protein